MVAGRDRIAFVSGRSGNDEVYVMDVTYSYLTRVTQAARQDTSPDWSPDVGRIVFASNRDYNSEVYIANADGSAQTRLTDDLAPQRGPAWSPDGSRIAFESFRDGQSEVYVVNSDGSGVARVIEKRCTGCRLCEDACGWSAIYIDPPREALKKKLFQPVELMETADTAAG